MKALPKVYREFFGAVPAGEVNIDGKMQTTTSLFMMQSEVSNKEYRDFLNDLKASGQTQAYDQYKIDSTGWLQLATYCEPFVTYYHQHPAYDNYPVVNVSYDGALAYAAWLESKMNVHAAKTGYCYEVRLPSKVEWIRAANGLQQQSNYAWGGPYVRNAKGCALCNFNGKLNAQDTIEVSLYHDDDAMITAPSKSYFPNVFGLYNLNGNVEEMVQERGIAMGGSWRSPADAVLNTSETNYTSPSPTLGFRCVVVLR